MYKVKIAVALILTAYLFATGFISGYCSYKPINEEDVKESILDNSDYSFDSYRKGFCDAYEEFYWSNFYDGWRQYDVDTAS